MTKYLRNEDGGVHSVDEAHLDLLMEESSGGNKFLPHGWTEISEDEARAANPQLFGVPDPQIVYSARELKTEAELRQYRGENTQAADIEAIVAQRVAEELAKAQAETTKAGK